MTRTKLLLTIAAVMLMALSVQVFAADEPAAPKGKALGEQAAAEEGNFGIVEKLGLSADQKTKIKGILEATKEERRTTMAARLEATKKLTQEALNGASEADIRAAASDLGKAAGDHAIAVSKTWGEIKPILTPEQQAKLKEMVAEKKEQVAEKRAEKVKERAERRAERTQKSTSDTSK
jgi:Spy/CpxP family protein refolding chaperone